MRVHMPYNTVFHTWINGHARMSLGKYWKSENLTIFNRENKNTCVGLD
jgi:hypothetical protein